MLSLVQNRVKSITISKAEISLLFILLIFGIPMIVLIPPGAGYDEEDHLVRVWELSAFSFIPGGMSPQEMRYPTVFRDFTYRQQGSTGVLNADFWQSYARASLYERGAVRRDLDTKSVYSPALLLPQAIAMRLFGRMAELPALTVFYLCRLAGLVSYLLLVWLAVRWMPFGEWILLVLAASPMALFQATTLSPDAISNGIGFLFFAGCLKLTGLTEIRWRETGYLLGLVFLLFLAKLNLIPLVLLPLLLFIPSKFSQKGMYAFLLLAIVILFVVEVAGWNAVASSNLNPLLANDANLTAQLLYILGHPFTFLQIILKDFIINGWDYFLGWINGYGYYYWTPPIVVSLFFLLSLISVIFTDSTSGQMSRRLRIVFLLVFLAGYFATILSLYTTFTPVGSDQILGVQGRYFVSLALLLLLVLSSLSWIRKLEVTSPRWITIFLTTALSLNLLGLFLSFHVSCGSTFYQTGLCYRPLFKDFPSEVRASPPITNQTSLTQEIRVTCNGFAELRVLLVPSTTENQATARFVLQNPATGEILLDTSVANDQVTPGDWYSLRFEPDWLSAGKQYALEILNTNPTSEAGLQVLYTPQSEFNLGNLHENGQLLEEDIVLQYGCITGLRKLGLTGKP
jgi:uncharacterized membrane protein